MIDWLQRGMPHLIVVPIVLPLLTAALLLLPTERHRRAKGVVNIASSLAGLVVALALLYQVDVHDAPGAIGVYLPSNWDVPFGIVLTVDRLSALMLVLAGLVGVTSALASIARWDAAGVHFHPLLQIQLLGLNGAFLTADLFNLFVFFEVLLAASYGLLLHGSGRARVRAGLHYVAVNLLASSLFLIGVALIYGVTGTLNMADLAQKVPHVPAADRGLLHAGAAILAIAFLTKAAMWPLNFWLASAYAAAAPPVAALFAVLTKVGVYTVLRLWTLLFSAQAGASALFGAEALIWGGLATLVFGAVGVLASQSLRRLAGYSIIVSSGTVLAAIGFTQPALTGAALYYLLSSTLAVSALFLLTELVDRSRQGRPAPIAEDDPLPFFVDAVESGPDTNLDEEEQALIGRTIPAAMAFLGLSFVVCALLIAGLPPLSGFLGKFGMLSAMLGLPDSPAPWAAPWGTTPPVSTAGWTLLALVVGSGLLSMIALSRAGIRFFWAPLDRPVPHLRVIECLPIVALLAACATMTVRAEPVMRYAQAAAASLHRPSQYIDAVMSARPVPGPSSAPSSASAQPEGTR